MNACWIFRNLNDKNYTEWNRYKIDKYIILKIEAFDIEQQERRRTTRFVSDIWMSHHWLCQKMIDVCESIFRMEFCVYKTLSSVTKNKNKCGIDFCVPFEFRDDHLEFDSPSLEKLEILYLYFLDPLVVKSYTNYSLFIWSCLNQISCFTVTLFIVSRWIYACFYGPNLMIYFSWYNINKTWCKSTQGRFPF